ncbi:TPA: GtrA family protein, partial [Klebsiella pneumoniae]|nr:GtrA family protein [Klebsiella pneumoniae]
MPSSGPLWQLMKYGLVGIVNTLITAVVIFLLRHLGLGIYLSNAMGYVVGIVFSFIANTI